MGKQTRVELPELDHGANREFAGKSSPRYIFLTAVGDQMNFLVTKPSDWYPPIHQGVVNMAVKSLNSLISLF